MILLLALACTNKATKSPQDADGDGFAANLDCDDTNFDINPAADERCNGIDDDCDEVIDDDPDDDDAYRVFWDADGDGFAGDDEEAVSFCEEPDDPGYVTVQGDCRPNDPSIGPGADEICDNDVDEDCDGNDPKCVDTSDTGP